MAKRTSASFTIDNYKISEDGDKISLIVEGIRSGQPSRRFTLSRTTLKIESVIITHTRKNKIFEHEVSRINYLPKAGQTRIHTKSPLYPGHYKLVIELSNAKSEIGQIDELFS